MPMMHWLGGTQSSCFWHGKTHFWYCGWHLAVTQVASVWHGMAAGPGAERSPPVAGTGAGAGVAAGVVCCGYCCGYGCWYCCGYCCCCCCFFRQPRKVIGIAVATINARAILRMAISTGVGAG